MYRYIHSLIVCIRLRGLPFPNFYPILADIRPFGPAESLFLGERVDGNNNKGKWQLEKKGRRSLLPNIKFLFNYSMRGSWKLASLARNALFYGIM
jgi:hypothetical protein